MDAPRRKHPLLTILALVGVGLAIGLAAAPHAFADGNLNNVHHIVVIMQENHSFDNYLGVLPLVPAGPYHEPRGSAGCSASDHRCVDGLSCVRDSAGVYTCLNSNPEADGALVFSFHDANYCPSPDLNHDWFPAHAEANFEHPNRSRSNARNDGFVRENDLTEQIDTGSETATDDDTMGFYDGSDLAYYYALAQAFALDDRYFADVVGPTIPNRFYLLAATSFGHLTTNEFLPPPGGYKPITGTIFDLLDQSGISWNDFLSDSPQGADFRPPTDPHFLPVSIFIAEAATGTLPAVSFVDPEFFIGGKLQNSEHPPADIRAGQQFVAELIGAVRNGPDWKDSVILLTYDEHGGFYDHVVPGSTPTARVNGGAKTPDGINPGQCEDLSNPPASEEPGGGFNCEISQGDALELCQDFTETGPYPGECATFNQLGFRVPFIAISPFAKPHYVSHTFASHTSILALIEKRFLGGSHLTLRDANATTIEDLFDFDNSPSASLNVPASLAPAPNLSTDGNGSCASP